MAGGKASFEIHNGQQHLVNLGASERVPYDAYESNMKDQVQNEQCPIPLIHSHAPTIDDCLILVKDALDAREEALHRRSSRVCIFKVPNSLMEINSKAYLPQTVSLGPSHFSPPATAKLSKIEIHKVRAMRRMVSQPNFVGKDSNWVVEEILKLEDEIRDYYEQPIECSGETLAWMLVLDGCFLLEIFKAYADPNTDEYVEPIFHEKRMESTGSDILTDIFKLENQIPLFVLRKLLEFQMARSTNDEVDTELIRLLVRQGPMTRFYPFNEDATMKCSVDQIRSARHILGLLHNIIAPSISERESESDSKPESEAQTATYLNIIASSLKRALVYALEYTVKLCGSNRLTSDATDNDQSYTVIPSAEELHNAGIEFRRCTEEIRTIRFDPKNATIFLPTIGISDETETIFRNLLAFEACQSSQGNTISSYVDLMDSLIDTEKDVALLRKRGIIESIMGSDREVAELFNGLCRQITISVTLKIQKLRRHVKEHYGSKRRVMLAEFRKKYCSRPWLILSVVAATLLLFMTAVQTIFSVFSVYTPSFLRVRRTLEFVSSSRRIFRFHFLSQEYFVFIFLVKPTEMFLIESHRVACE